MAETASPPANRAKPKMSASYSMPAAGVAPVKTIFVIVPSEGRQVCASPFQALGFKGDNTTIDSGTILVPANPDMVGTVVPDGNVPDPYDWAIDFDDPPCDTPLTLIVRGTVTDPATGNTTTEQAIVPFECVCP